MKRLEHRCRPVYPRAPSALRSTEAAPEIPPTRVDHSTSYRAQVPHGLGLTLVEVVGASALIALMLVAALNIVGATAKGYARVCELQQGTVLADQLMAEIVQQRYEDPNGDPVFGLEGGESSAPRTGYDDVDDYHGWSACPPQSKDGTTLAGADTWTREVTVQWVDTLDPTVVVGSESGLKRITVTATSDRGALFTRVALRSNAGMLELQSPLDLTYIVGLETALQTGTEGPATLDSTAIGNHARSQ